MQDPALFYHYNEIDWDESRWPNFTPEELACPCCGEFYYDSNAFDMIQGVRVAVRRPIVLNSVHRCPIHNAHVGGAPLSRHKETAFDINLGNQDRRQLYRACVDAGFLAFGFYFTFLHTDPRPWAARWYSKGKGVKELWEHALGS